MAFLQWLVYFSSFHGYVSSGCCRRYGCRWHLLAAVGLLCRCGWLDADHRLCCRCGGHGSWEDHLRLVYEEDHLGSVYRLPGRHLLLLAWEDFPLLRGGFSLHFLSAWSFRTNSQKRPGLRGRLSDYRNHSKNSLRSDSFSCRFACLASAIQESKKIPIIVHPINTSSCGMFLRIHSKKHEAQFGYELARLARFSEANSQCAAKNQKHSARRGL